MNKPAAQSDRSRRRADKPPVRFISFLTLVKFNSLGM